MRYKFLPRGFMIVLIGFLCAISVPASATNFNLTTHEVAACKDATDLPICILRLVVDQDDIAISSDLANSPDLLRLISPNYVVPNKNTSRSAYDWAMTAPMQEMTAIVSRVLEQDALAKLPSESLELIRNFGQNIASHSFAFGQIRTPSGAEFRLSGYWAIFEAYKNREARASNHQPVPSRALTLAAIEGIKAEIPNTKDSETPEEFANIVRAYALIGEWERAEAASRHDEKAEGQYKYHRLKFYLESNDLERASNLASNSIANSGPITQFQELRLDTLRRALAANRTDLVKSVGLSFFNRQKSEYEEKALPILLAVLSQSEALELLAPFDAAARFDLDSEKAKRRTWSYYHGFDYSLRTKSIEQAAMGAIIAVRGWHILGREDKVDEIIALWRPRAVAFRTDVSCSDNTPTICQNTNYYLILVAADRLEQGFGEPKLSLEKAIVYELASGHDLSRFEVWKSRANSPLELETAYHACLQWISYHSTSFEYAPQCARKMLESAKARELTTEEIAAYGNLPYIILRTSATIAGGMTLNVADYAISAKKSEIARELLDIALEAFSAGRDARLSALVMNPSSGLYYVAIDMLREQGRLH